jgi:hypothetical protein
MKNLKFLLFAVAMLLTVCVQAENKPETVANVTPEPVVAKVSAEPADVEQTPCSFSYISRTCENFEVHFVITVANEDACKRAVNMAITLINLTGC